MILDLFRNPKIMLLTGGFDPLHSGHIAYFQAGKDYIGKHGILAIGINSDKWLERKKGKAFLPFEERKTIIQNLKMVDMVITLQDDDDTAISGIIALENYWYGETKIFFGNGGDRVPTNTPEMDWVHKTGRKNVEFVFGLGGSDKINSSSWILDKWTSSKT